MSDYPLFELQGLRFGGDEPIKVSNFDPGSASVRSGDAENEVGDGIRLGRDYLTPPTWAFDIFTDVNDWAEALELDDRLAAVWQDEETRTTIGRAVPLRYWMAGRWRRVYGRPRQYAGADGGLLTKLGRGEMTADFSLVDRLHYADDEQSISVGSVPETTGGIVFPVVFPLVTMPRTSTERPGQFTVGGTAPTWPRVMIHGPITNAVIHVGDWSMRTTGTVREGDTLTIDAAPWAQSITRSDGASVAGMLHPSTSLSSLRLKPGHHELVLAGQDSTGLARATIAWRDAYYRL